jgi:spore maturation protein CgeB
MKMKFVILGLSITSSWGNGHATTYRGLLGGLAERGHEVIFLERDVPWYADNFLLSVKRSRVSDFNLRDVNVGKYVC